MTPVPSSRQSKEETHVETLQRLDQMLLFDGLPRAELALWANRFRRESYSKQDVIIRKGARAGEAAH
jgi:hypothetical protein